MICWTCFGARAKEPRSHKKWREARRRRGGLVLWWFATDARRQSGPDRFLPSSLSFAGVSHREQRVLRLRLLLFLAVSAAGSVAASGSGSGSGSDSDSSPAGLKDAGGEVELDKGSPPGHGPQEVMLLPAGPGKELMLCKSYHLAGLVGGVWRRGARQRGHPPSGGCWWCSGAGHYSGASTCTLSPYLSQHYDGGH